MPLYGTAQAGYNGPPNQGLNLTSLIPGESITLFDGTETPVALIKSIAFARGYSPSADDAGITFSCSGLPGGATINVEWANQDIDGDYNTGTVTLSPDGNGNTSYTDIGRSAFYRVSLSAYASGTMPIVIAQR